MFASGDKVICGCCGGRGVIERESAGRWWVQFETYRMYMPGTMLRRA